MYLKKFHYGRFSLRRFFNAVRKEALVAFTNTIVVAASTLLVLLALNGMNSPHLNRSDSFNSTFPLSPVQRLYEKMQENISVEQTWLAQEIHDSFSVPHRFLQSLTYANLEDLLSTMRTPRKGILLPPINRGLFTHVTGQSFIERIRAMATVVAYARATNRVPIIYWHLHEGFERPFDTELYWVCQSSFPLVIVNDVLDQDLVSRENQRLANKKPERNVENLMLKRGSVGLTNNLGEQRDWAEFSLQEIASDLGTTDFSALNHQSVPWEPQHTNNDALHHVSSNNSMHVNLKKEFSSTAIALDILATSDNHVELPISRAVRSRYTPLIDAEEGLQKCLRGKTKAIDQIISSAHLTATSLAKFEDINIVESLHGEFQIPYILLESLRPEVRRLLLDKLLRKQNQGQFAPRTFWIHPQYGLGNRLRALGSAMAFARRTGRVLVLIWEPDAHLNCFFRDLFVGHDDIIVGDSFRPRDDWPFLTTKSIDVSMHAVEWYNCMRINGVQMNHPTDPILDAPTKHIYVSTAYVVQSPVLPGIVRTQSVYWKILQSLTPHVSVARIVNKHAVNFDPDIMGVHIRGRSIKTDISGVSISDYSEESSRRTDYWRNLTGVAAFISEMRKQSNKQLFYIAADEKEVPIRVEKEFPGRVFFTPRQCDSRSRECLPYALADILLLAKCKSIRGSYWSSFSELSCRWGGAKYLLAGVDFGKPINNSRYRK